MARNNDATLAHARAQLHFLLRLIDELSLVESQNAVGSGRRRELLYEARSEILGAATTLRLVLRDHPVALVAGDQWQPGQPRPCDRCGRLVANYVIAPEGFALCLKTCAPVDRLVMR
jgi:hypothetical protein